MIKLIILIAILSLAVIAGPFTSESQGFVHIAAGNYIIETSLTSAVLIAIIFTSALFIILSIIKRFIKIPVGASSWLRRHNRIKSGSLQDMAYIAYEEGEYERTLSLLAKSGKTSELPLHALFVGAKSAFNAGNYDKCREYLDRAEVLNEEAKKASKIIRAKLNLRLNNSKAALEELSSLRQSQRNKLICRLYLLCYQHENNVEKLAEIAGDLVKHKLITSEEAGILEARALKLRLNAATDAASVHGLWKTLSKQTRRDPAALGAYTKRLIETGDISNARTTALSVLKEGLNPDFLEAIAHWDTCIPEVLKAINAKAQNNAIAGGVNLPLLKAKANLELRDGLLQEALADYKRALEFAPTAEIYNKIGQVLAHQQNFAEATDCFIKASTLKDEDKLPLKA